MEKSILSLQKALDILCSFDFRTGGLSAQMVSKELNIPLSTTYRYLKTLEEKRFLTRNLDTKRYTLGFMLFQLGNMVVSEMKFIEVLMPHMKSLSSLSGETVFLTILSGWRAVCLERIETRRLIKMSLDRGRSLPLHAGASSKILLAYQEDSFIDSMIQEVGLPKLTSNTITKPSQLKKELRAIREQGLAFSDQEVDLGARAISAPIFDHKGTILGGLSVAGPRERMKKGKTHQLMQLVKDSAKRASYDLGYLKVKPKNGF